MAFKMNGWSAFTKKAPKTSSPLTVSPDLSEDPSGGPGPNPNVGPVITVSAKDQEKRDKKNKKTKTKSEHKKSKIDVKTAKKLYGKDSQEYKDAVAAAEAAKTAKKESQTGRQKIRTKIQEGKDERTRKQNINQAKKDAINKAKAEAKWAKDNPNIPMP